MSDHVAFVVAVLFAAVISLGVYAHASKHGSGHATAWGSRRSSLPGSPCRSIRAVLGAHPVGGVRLQEDAHCRVGRTAVTEQVSGAVQVDVAVRGEQQRGCLVETGADELLETPARDALALGLAGVCVVSGLSGSSREVLTQRPARAQKLTRPPP